MTLKDARVFRDYIINKNGINCTVPLGFGPDGYFPCSIMRDGPRFASAAVSCAPTRRCSGILAVTRRVSEVARGPSPSIRRARSPIELMIDRACGLA